MSKLSIFAAVFLFWTALAASLMQVQLVASPVHKMLVPTYRSLPMRSDHRADTGGRYHCFLQLITDSPVMARPIR